MIIRTYNPLSNNIYNRRQAKNISTSIPLAIPAVPNVYNTFLLPPPERFPVSGFVPEGAEWENGAHSPTELLSLPGHSMGSMVILLDGECLFSGDSLIAGYPISLRFPGGSRKAWREIGEKRLNSLPRGLRVYPGHFHDFVWGDTGLTD